MERRLFIVATLLALALGVHGQNLIPMPRKYTPGKGILNTKKPFERITVSDAGISGGEEAYQLHITKDSMVVRYNAPIGMVRAEETLRQLTDGKGYIHCCDITDWPEYSWRGFMLDVSRHFFPLSYLKEQVDLLSRYKINRLHIHLVDAAGWRLEIKHYPRLTNTAAWRTESDWQEWWVDGERSDGSNGSREYTHEGEGYGGYYTQEEMKDLVSYAAKKGIEIVPEIEMPGHSEEILTVYPELACRHAWDSGDSSLPMTGDVCPGNEGVYSFFENVLDEVMEIFPSKYIHIGGDEAGMGAWNSCPICKKKKEELGITDNHALQTYLINRIGTFLESRGRHMIGWDEIINENLNPEANVMVWRNSEYAKKAAEQGCDVIMSPGNYCYFDKDPDAPDTTKNVGMGWLSLEKVYSFNPCKDLDAQDAAHIKGLQANLWTEWVPDTSRCQLLTYPRILAIAEIGWNGERKVPYYEWRKRCTEESKSLRAIGVNVFDITKERGERKESLKPVRHKAVGCTVTYNQPFSEIYPSNKEQALADGLKGGWIYSDGKWQGFVGNKALDVVVDLGHEQSISSISMEFMNVSNSWVWFPKLLKYSVSSDGENWTSVYSHDNPIDKRLGFKFKTFTWKGKQHNVRYVRAEGSAQKEEGWIFTDEIVVR